MSKENKLPKDWKIVISSEIMDVRDGTHDTPKYVLEKGIPLITSKNLKGNKIDFEKVSYISSEDHNEISKRSKVENGDILFAMIGTIGNPAIIKGNSNFSIKNVGLFKKNESIILPEFFVNFLRSSFFEKQLNERKLLKGTTQRFIPLGNLRKIEIPLPPLKTQQQIVSKIEELFSELDKGVEDLKKAQQQLKTYRQSVLKWAFEGRLTNENVKDGVLPKGWEIKKLGNLFSFVGGGTPSKNEPSFWNGNIPWASIKDIKGDYLSRTFDFITEKGLNNSATNLAKKGELIIATRINPGRPIITKIDTAINQDLKIVRPKLISSVNFSYYLFLNIENQILKKSSGTTVLGIRLEILNDIDIFVPILAEQEKIVHEIESRLSVADKLEENIKESLQQAEALRQSILKKAFSGELIKS